MHAIIDLCVVPVGVGISVSEYVTECHRIIRKSGLNHTLHAYGTNIEGPWDDVMAVVKECHEKLHEMGVPRIHTNIKIGTRNDRSQTMQDKINSVEQKLT